MCHSWTLSFKYLVTYLFWHFSILLHAKWDRAETFCYHYWFLIFWLQQIDLFWYFLHPTTFGCRDKLLVAPCGFDSSTWDPSNDKFLTENYCAEDMKGKTVCKVTLQQQLGLSKDASTIVVSVIQWSVLNDNIVM